MKNDIPCGSTVETVWTASLGCKTVDVSLPQLLVHAFREMCGVEILVIPTKTSNQFLILYMAVYKLP